MNKKVYIICAFASLSLLAACGRKKEAPKKEMTEVTVEEVTLENAAQERTSGPQINDLEDLNDLK